MLSELKFSENDEQLEKTRLIASSSNLINSKVSAMESLDAGRRQFIQNSLKESLIRLHASAMGVPKTSTSKIQPKNSGYFLPHNLQVQRAAARRSYLLSLNKPRLNKLVEKNKKSSTTIHTKLPSFSTTSGNIQPKGYQKKKVQKKQGAVKFRKKLDVSTQVDLLENPANGEANLNEQASEYKDENIECAVDGILTDLLGETVLSLNAIKQRKSKQTLSKTVGEKENTLQKYGSGADEIPAQHFRSDFNETVFKNEDKRDIGEKGEHLLPDLKNELRNPIGNDDQVSQKLSEEKQQGLLSHKYSSEAQKQTVPKTLRISIDSSRRIAKYRKEFWNYLKATSWVANENFNPWVLADI
ncbi:uncharacterized protein LOC129226083 isoform X2 [Uloborus diversus]|uniref:uncharacterized protein LOC129226083 isoform X2 n=1 Tax=Uloborus diversus TaxID=327109 RepID=UPI00240A4262|nr:uncharacterized protein LOC129226083 isoform X2 [Uloborus diversus]